MSNFETLRVFVEVGKRFVLQAKGRTALILAAGAAVTAVKAADYVGEQLKAGSVGAWDWMKRQIGS